MIDACEGCVRRSWLVGRLATGLEVIRAGGSRVREVLALSDEQLIDALAGERRGGVRRAWERADAAALGREWETRGDGAICRHSPRYPAGLLDLPDPPAVLHLHGDPERIALLDAGAAPAVALVGARRASPAGLDVARTLGRELSAAGVTVISGMAMGIDAAAHEGALGAGARTVAVLACAADRAYPRSRARLHRALAAHALVVSELPPGIEPFRWAFPARNRIIAALARATVIVEAAQRSGSLITAEIAADLGREVGAVPGSPLSWHAGGTNALLRDGAHLVRGAADVLDDLFGVGTAGAPRPDPAARLDPRLAALLAAVDRGEDPLAAGGEPAQALTGLTRLELLGLLERSPGGGYRRTAR